MDNFKEIITQVNDRTGFICFNRTNKHNALNIRMRNEITQCLGVWEQDVGLKVVVFKGNGERSFSTGFDLEEFSVQEKHKSIFESSHQYHLKLWNYSKPSIAAINGYCMGGGMDLATLCDIRICSENAIFGHPEIKFGAPPLLTPLRWIVGEGRARELIITGRKIDADEALRIGFVTQVVPENKLEETALQLAAQVSDIPEETFRLMRFCFIRPDMDFETAFSIEHDRAFREIILPGFSKPNKRNR